MKCEICSKDVETIIHFCGVDRCLKCDLIKRITPYKILHPESICRIDNFS